MLVDLLSPPIWWPENSVNICNLGPVQMPLHSRAEPKSTKFDLGAMADLDGVLASNLIWEGCGKQFSMRNYVF